MINPINQLPVGGDRFRQFSQDFFKTSTTKQSVNIFLFFLENLVFGRNQTFHLNLELIITKTWKKGRKGVSP